MDTSYRERNIKSQRKRHKELRLEIFNIIGKICTCRDESILELLTVEHKNNDGDQHRKRMPNMTTRLKDILNDPLIKEKYDVLCHNCNWVKVCMVYVHIRVKVMYECTFVCT